MNETTPKPGFTYSVSATDGKLETIRGQALPPGTVAAFGVGAVSAAGREVTTRAVEMTAGLFGFAEQSNRKDPDSELE